MLHLFVLSRSAGSQESSRLSRNNTPIAALAKACIHAARHSSELLTNLWIEGALSTLGYFDAQYLFSSAIILAISGVSEGGSKDIEQVESTAQILKVMADSGNLSATEFSGHLEQVRRAIEQHCSTWAANVGNVNSLEGAGTTYDTPNTTMYPLTTEMALLQPPMQDFLTQADFAFDFPNPVEDLYGTSLLYN